MMHAFPFDPEHLLGKSIVIYGPSGSGKTQIVKAILDVLHSELAAGVVVSPSEPANRAYEKYFPPPLIYLYPASPPEPGMRGKDTPEKSAKRFFTKIIDRQSFLKSAEQASYDVKILERIYNRNFDPISGPKEERLAHYRRNLPAADVETHDVDEKAAIQGIGLNSNFVLVLDDCAAQLTQVWRSTEFRPLLYQNRHLSTTAIITCQDDSDLQPNLRKNAHITIFADAGTAVTNFERSSNGFSRETQERARENIKKTFKGYEKLVYWRTDPRAKHFYTLLVKESPAPKMVGGKVLQDYCNKLMRKKNYVAADHPLARYL